MNVRTSFCALALLLCVVLAVAKTSDGAQSPASAAQATVGSTSGGDPRVGKATFIQYCSICHGVAGKGFIGPRIGGIDWTAAGLRSIVRGGLGGYGGMPSFNAAVVTDRNVGDISAYLASLAPAQTPVASATPAQAPVASATRAPSAASPTAVAALGDAGRGHQLYSVNCSACHGASAQGGYGPSLRGEKTRKDDAAAIAWIKNPKPPMPKLYPDPLSDRDVRDIAAYIESL